MIKHINDFNVRHQITLMEEVIKKRKLSAIGRLFYNIDISCNNSKIFVRKHYHTIDFVFLSFYVLLQIILVVLIYFFKNHINRVELIVSIFIIIFLFLLSSERIVLQFKSKQAQDEKDNIEIQYYDLSTENKILRQKNKDLIDKMEFILEYKKTKR